MLCELLRNHYLGMLSFMKERKKGRKGKEGRQEKEGRKERRQAGRQGGSKKKKKMFSSKNSKITEEDPTFICIYRILFNGLFP